MPDIIDLSECHLWAMGPFAPPPTPRGSRSIKTSRSSSLGSSEFAAVCQCVPTAHSGEKNISAVPRKAAWSVVFIVSAYWKWTVFPHRPVRAVVLSIYRTVRSCLLLLLLLTSKYMSPLINGIKYLQPARALFSGCGFRALPKDLCSTNILGLKWAPASTCKQHIEISKFIDFPLDGLKEEEEAFWY